MFGSDWVPTNNPAWEDVQNSRIFRRKGTEFYMSVPLEEKGIDEWHGRGVRVVLWKGLAAEFLLKNSANDTWKEKVEVISSLDEFLGAQIEGEPMWPSE